MIGHELLHYREMLCVLVVRGMHSVLVQLEYCRVRIRHNDGLEAKSVTALAISNNGLVLYAGTNGGGVYLLSTLSQEELVPRSPSEADTPEQAPTPSPRSDSPTDQSTEEPVSQGTENGDTEGFNLPCLNGAIPIGLILILRFVGPFSQGRNRRRDVT